MMISKTKISTDGFEKFKITPEMAEIFELPMKAVGLWQKCKNNPRGRGFKYWNYQIKISRARRALSKTRGISSVSPGSGNGRYLRLRRASNASAATANARAYSAGSGTKISPSEEASLKPILYISTVGSVAAL